MPAQCPAISEMRKWKIYMEIFHLMSVPHLSAQLEYRACFSSIKPYLILDILKVWDCESLEGFFVVPVWQLSSSRTEPHPPKSVLGSKMKNWSDCQCKVLLSFWFLLGHVFGICLVELAVHGSGYTTRLGICVYLGLGSIVGILCSEVPILQVKLEILCKGNCHEGGKWGRSTWRRIKITLLHFICVVN